MRSQCLRIDSFISVGIPRVWWIGVDGAKTCLVMELLGSSLEDLFNRSGRRFSAMTVCLLADQMLSRIEAVHGKGLIHRDIKPENFVIGTV